MNPRNRCKTSALAAGLLAVFVSAAGAQPANMTDQEKKLYTAAKAEGAVTWYVSQIPTERADEACRMFSAKYPGVGCNAVRASGQVVFQRLMQEVQANAVQADVISTNDDAHLLVLKQRGQIAEYLPANAAYLVPALRDPADQKFWSVTAISPLGIVYNTNLVKADEAPRNWTDLLDPKWKGQVAVGHPGFSGSVGVWSIAMDQIYGGDFFTRLAKNDPQVGRSVLDGYNLVLSGERKISLAPLVTVEDAARQKKAPVKAVYPVDGAVLPPGVSAVLAKAVHPNAARLFMEFLLDVEYSDYMAKDTRWPVNEKVDAPASLPPLSKVKLLKVPTEEAMRKLKGVQQAFRSALGV